MATNHVNYSPDFKESVKTKQPEITKNTYHNFYSFIINNNNNKIVQNI